MGRLGCVDAHLSNADAPRRSLMISLVSRRVGPGKPQRSDCYLAVGIQNVEYVANIHFFVGNTTLILDRVLILILSSHWVSPMALRA